MMQRKVYETEREKRNDFIIGFILWFVINGILLGVTALTANLLYGPTGIMPSDLEVVVDIVTVVVGCLPFVINIGLLIYFGVTRSWMALGFVAAFASLLVLAIIAGIIFTVACFIGYSNL